MKRAAVPTAALVALLCLLWALTFIVQRSVLDSEIEPLWLAAGRSLLAAALLAPLLWRRPRLDAKGWRIAALLGMTNIVGFTGGQMLGLAEVGAGPAAAIIYVQPVLVTLGAWLFLRESLTAGRMLGVLLGLAGVAVISTHEITHVSFWATVVLAGAALSWSAGTLITRATPEQPVLAIVAAQHVVGGPLLLAAAAATEPAPTLTWHVVWAIGFAGVGGSAVGWMIFTTLLRRGEAGAVAAWLFSVPIAAAVLGVLLLGEPLRIALVAGLVLVSAGVRLAAARGTRQPAVVRRASRSPASSASTGSR
jgi:drug/metabolite transporter (DMT)-like permease